MTGGLPQKVVSNAERVLMPWRHHDVLFGITMAEVNHVSVHGWARFHYSDVTMSAMASQFTSISSVYSIVCSGADKRKNQSSASLAFVMGIHRWPLNSPHERPVTRKMFHMMTSSCFNQWEKTLRVQDLPSLPRPVSCVRLSITSAQWVVTSCRHGRATLLSHTQQTVQDLEIPKQDDKCANGTKTSTTSQATISWSY